MQPTTSADALTQLQQTQASAQNPNDILSAQRQQLGVQGAQDTVTGLRGAINNTTKLLNQVAPSVMGRTGGSLVTNAQAGKQIQNEQAPISQNLSTETGDYNNAQQDLDKLNTEAQTAASGIYTGQQDKQSYLQNLYSTLYGKEQDAATTARQAAQDAEAKREFDVGESNKMASANAGASPTLGSSAGGLPQGVSLKNAQAGGGAGYNFNFGGTPVSAARYAQLAGSDLRNILYNMGNSGDKTAAAALQDLTKSGGKWTPEIKSKYSSLFWGI